MQLASFVRYLNTFVLGAVLALLCMLLCTFPEKEKETEETRPYGRCFVVSVLFLAIVCAAACPVIGIVGRNCRAPYEKFIAINESLDEGESIYIITHEGTGMLESPVEYQYILFRFYATPNDCSGLKVGGSPYRGDNFKSYYTVEETLAAYEAGGYDYLYLHYIDDAFCARFSDIFEDSPRAFTLYVRAENGLFRGVGAP